MVEHVGCLRECMEEHHGGALGPAGGASCDAPEFHGEHEAHFADHTEAQSVDLDCHRRETSAFLDNFRAVLACHCGEHKAHLADLLESLRQVEALADHPWSVSMERDLADALAASKAGSAVLEDASGSTCRSRRSPQPSAGPGPSGERGAPWLWLALPPRE